MEKLGQRQARTDRSRPGDGRAQDGGPDITRFVLRMDARIESAHDGQRYELTAPIRFDGEYLTIYALNVLVSETMKTTRL
ncbi:MAG: hypothetical protein WD688_25515 [Candidatus Binatia bacterium]